MKSPMACETSTCMHIKIMGAFCLYLFQVELHFWWHHYTRWYRRTVFLLYLWIWLGPTELNSKCLYLTNVSDLTCDSTWLKIHPLGHTWWNSLTYWLWLMDYLTWPKMLILKFYLWLCIVMTLSDLTSSWTRLKFN